MKIQKEIEYQTKTGHQVEIAFYDMPGHYPIAGRYKNNEGRRKGVSN